MDMLMPKAVITIIGGFAFNPKLLNFINKRDITVSMIDINLFPATYTLDDMTNEVVGQLDSNKQNIILAYSTGGLIALRIASTQADLLTQVILLNSTPKFIHSENWNGIKETDFKLLYTRLDKESPIEFLPYFAILAAYPKKIKRLEYQNYFSNSTKESLLNLLNIIQTTDLRLELLSLKTNTLFINSSDDILVPRNSLPTHCQQTILPDSSHTQFNQELILKILTEVLCKHNMV